MIVISKPTLALFRAKPRCEWCRKPADGPLDPHHIFARGMGAGGQLDISINLVALNRGCHDDAGAGVITRFDLLAIVAQREACLQDDIVSVIDLFRRLGKDPSAAIISGALEELRKSAAALARRVLKEIGR